MVGNSPNRAFGKPPSCTSRVFQAWHILRWGTHGRLQTPWLCWALSRRAVLGRRLRAGCANLQVAAVSQALNISSQPYDQTSKPRYLCGLTPSQQDG